MTALVTATENDSHFLLTMDDGKANALSFDMLDSLNAGLDRAAATGKVVIITGRPGKFCAGFDLSVMGQGGEEAARLLHQGAEVAGRLLTFETPVVLAVSGHALAMGALLCLSVDYRIGAEGDYKLGLNEVAIGMTLPWFGVELARARLAQVHLDQAVDLARIYDPAGAVEAGFLDEAVPAGELATRAADMAAALATLNMEAHRNTKKRVREPLAERLKLALQRDFEAGGVQTASS
ncbi:crotonase/enoyl-CoA hydratase family protein [Lentisalinibacter salinarum]|uniref:crotonase/enoyl-CoA hydratase family protein n=1 Tax=Lentisalinibacter salinarum TaxID=2992239 RepID=UPI0038652B1F